MSKIHDQRWWEKPDVQSLQDDRIIEVGAHYSEGKRFEERESGQEDKVEWVLMAFPVK